MKRNAQRISDYGVDTFTECREDLEDIRECDIRWLEYQIEQHGRVLGWHIATKSDEELNWRERPTRLSVIARAGKPFSEVADEKLPAAGFYLPVCIHNSKSGLLCGAGLDRMNYLQTIADDIDHLVGPCTGDLKWRKCPRYRAVTQEQFNRLVYDHKKRRGLAK